MRDFNRVVGLIFNHRGNGKEMKQVLVELASRIASDDLVIINNVAYQGPGETTGAIANTRLPLDSESFVSSLRCMFHLGDLDCSCDKCLFIIGDRFDDDFKFNLNKFIKINDQRHYGIKFYVFNLSGSWLPKPIFEGVSYKELSSFSDLKEELFTTFDSLDQIIPEMIVPDIPDVLDIQIKIPDIAVPLKLVEENVVYSLIDTYCPSCNEYVAGHQHDKEPLQLTCGKCEHTWKYGEIDDDDNEV